MQLHVLKDIHLQGQDAPMSGVLASIGVKQEIRGTALLMGPGAKRTVRNAMSQQENVWGARTNAPKEVINARIRYTPSVREEKRDAIYGAIQKHV